MSFFDTLSSGIGEFTAGLAPDNRRDGAKRRPGSGLLNWFDLSAPVGLEGENRPADVLKVESLLGETGHLDLDETAGPTGSWDARTDTAARSFQRDQGLAIDGLLAPAGPTIGRLGDTLGGKVVAKPVKAPSPTAGNPLDGANPLGVMPGAGANPLAEAAPEPKPWLQPAPKPPSPLPARADTAGVVVPDEAIAANRRLVDHLKTTSADGPLPTYLAGDAGLDAGGHVEVDDFFAQLHEHLPERARTLGAKVRTLMDATRPAKPAKPAGIVETRPAKPGETWDPVRGKWLPGAPPRAETETAPEPETFPNYRWDPKAGRFRPVRPHGSNQSEYRNMAAENAGDGGGKGKPTLPGGAGADTLQPGTSPKPDSPRPPGVPSDDPAKRDRADGEEAGQNPVPVLNMPDERTASILADTPARFEIKDNPNADGSKALHEWSARAKKVVSENDGLIEEMAKKHDVDPDLIRAVMWSENARGHWGGAGKLADSLGISNSAEPMNVDKEKWSSLLGKNPHEMYDTRNNVEAGTILLKRIRDRIEAPTAAKIGSIWVYSGREKVHDFGAVIQRVYDEKPWRNNNRE